MMKKMAGLLAGAALVGGLALAQQDSTPAAGGSGLGQEQKPSEQKPSMMPGQATGQTDVSKQGNELTGTVIESKSHTLYLSHMGAVVPVRVEKSTDLTGLSGKKLTDLKSGDEVQVAFEVKNKIDNVATKIGLSSATGGSGLGSSGAGSTTGEDKNVGKPDEHQMKPPKSDDPMQQSQPSDPQKPILLI